MNQNDWLNDQTLKGIDMEKLLLLNELAGQSKGKTSNELLPFLLAATNKANAKGMKFTPNEMELIISVLKQGMTPEEQAKVDKIRTLMASRH